MAQTFYKFPSIGQFRNIVKDVRHFDPAAKLTFTGTVKVHGTNAAVVIHPDGTYHCQSRSRIVTTEDDNLGFAAWVAERYCYYADMLSCVRNLYKNDDIVIYGEFAGRGIQKGVAVNAADKFFYIFGVKAGDKWSSLALLNHPEDRARVFFSYDAWGKSIDIDFSQPEASQNELVSITDEVEAQCPLGKHLGLDGTGEGVVWSHMTDDNHLLMFKVKGEKHSVSKVKKLAQVDPEKVASVAAFIEYAVTDNRLQQGLQEVCDGEADREKMGAFLKWVSLDVRKEEFDVLAGNDLTMKDIGKALSGKARAWFFEQEKT